MSKNGITVKCMICDVPVDVESASIEDQEILDAQSHGECGYYCDACMPGIHQAWS